MSMTIYILLSFIMGFGIGYLACVLIDLASNGGKKK